MSNEPPYDALLNGATWEVILQTQNSAKLPYFIISWAGWHPTSASTLHKMSYKYGLDIGEDATDTRRRVSRFIKDLWAKPDHGFTHYFWDATCWDSCPGINLVNLASTYLYAKFTYAVLDVRDSLCLQDYLLIGEAAHTFNQGPVGSQTTDNLLQDFLAVLKQSVYYDYKPKKKHSFWTRGWISQEQLYSSELVYVHQVNSSDPRIETPRQICLHHQEAIAIAVEKFRQLDEISSALALLERYLDLGLSINLRPMSGTSPWTSYCSAAAVLPKQALDSRTLADVLRNVYLELPAQPFDQQADQNALLQASIPLMISSCLSQSYVSIPRLWKPRKNDPVAAKCRSWCYNAVLEMETDKQFQFTTTDILFGLGRLRSGVSVEFAQPPTYLKINVPCIRLELATTLLRTRPQQGCTLEELEQERARPLVVKTGIVLANFVEDNETEFDAFAIAEGFCWLTAPDNQEVSGYVDFPFLFDNVPGIKGIEEWESKEWYFF